MKYLFFRIILICLVSCNVRPNQVNESNWSLLDAPYSKHGEMMAYDGYWVEAYRDTTKNNIMFLLVDRENKFKISDSLKIESLPNGSDFDYGSVLLNGQLDRSLIVTYNRSNSNIQSNILKAWRANTATGKFEVILTNGIQVATVK
jgi:UDP-N-acetylmuramyl tripeptide synthase